MIERTLMKQAEEIAAAGHLGWANTMQDAAAELAALRKALAGISEEMGLPETMGPAKGELKRLLDNGKAAIDSLREAPIAIFAEADFDAMTWTFRVAPYCRIVAGKYALVWMGPNAELSGFSPLE